MLFLNFAELLVTHLLEEKTLWKKSNFLLSSISYITISQNGFSSKCLQRFESYLINFIEK